MNFLVFERADDVFFHEFQTSVSNPNKKWWLLTKSGKFSKKKTMSRYENN
jgi:hypothetical protein